LSATSRPPRTTFGGDQLQVGAVARAVGVEEDEVERPGERGEGLRRGALADLDVVRQARARQVGAGLGDLLGAALQRDHAPPGLAGGVGEPDGRVAVRRPDLEDARGAGAADEDPQEPPGVGRDVELPPPVLGLAGVVRLAEPRQLVQPGQSALVHGSPLPARS
jgi:hypothetical protein